MLQEDLDDEARHLHARFLRDVGENEHLVGNASRPLDLHRLNDGGCRHVADLRVDRPENGVSVHHDLVRSERDQRAPAHRVVRHEHGHFSLSLDQRLRDLLSGENQPARRVQDDVDRLLRGRVADGAQHGLGIVDADAVRDGDAEQARAFLAVDHRDHPGIALPLELAERSRALPVDAARAGELKQDDDREQQPERGAREIREVL